MNYKKVYLYVITAALLGTSPAAFAQGGTIGRNIKLQKANRNYYNNHYALALEQYIPAVGNHETSLKTASRIADSYRQLQRTEEAETWYAKVVAMPNRAPENLYYYAEMLRSNGKYEEAKAQYEKWAKEQPAMAARAQELMASTDFAVNELKKQPTATIQAQAQLNSDRYSEFSPRSFNGGIIFTSDRSRGVTNELYGLTGRPYLKLYSAKLYAQDDWISPGLINDLSQIGMHNSTGSAPADNKTIYFTRSRNSGGNTNADPTHWIMPLKGKGGSNNLGIFYAERNGDRWLNITPFTYNKVNEYSVSHPAISADGNVLYFVSDMPGGQGDTDIYYTTRQSDGNWGEPVNAGPVINTAGKESFPYVDENGKLYFSSTGHEGFGGLDIFVAKGTLANWTKVTNMGQPVNSSKNDFGIMFTEAGKEGLLSSNRDSKNGTDDIFAFTLLARPVVVAINTSSSSNATTEDVKIDIRQKGSEESIAAVTDKSGRYYLNARVGEEYEIRTTKVGFQEQIVPLKILDTAGDTLSMPVILNEANAIVVIKTMKRNSNVVDDVDVTITKKGSDKVVNVKSNTAGEIIIPGRVGDKFTVKGKKVGYLNQSLEVTIPESANDTVSVAMHFESNKEEQPIAIDIVYYDLDKWAIRKDAAIELNKLVSLLKENPEISVEIGSHTDSRQTRKYNQKLSEKRAKAVVNYLVKRGINKRRLTSKGYGETMLLNNCTNGVKCSPKEHQLNRRTEFKIIKKQ